MNAKRVINHFGSIKDVAEACGIEIPSVYEWLRNGVVPSVREWQIEVLTRGKFKAKRPRRAA